MCCLAYENDHYAETVKLMPKVGAEVMTPEGKGVNMANDLLKRTVKVKITKGEETTIKDFPLKDVKFKEKMKVMASGPITSWEVDGETVEAVSDFIFFGLQNH